MTFATAFTTVGALLGILGLTALVAAAVVTSIADLASHDLVTAPVPTDGPANGARR